MRLLIAGARLLATQKQSTERATSPTKRERHGETEGNEKGALGGVDVGGVGQSKAGADGRGIQWRCDCDRELD